MPEVSSGYSIYNLTRVGENAYEGLLVLTLRDAPAGETWDSTVHSRWLAVQPLRAEKEGGRWVILPQGDFWTVQGDQRDGSNLGLPAKVYEARYGDFTIRALWQNTARVDSYVQNGSRFWNFMDFDRTPKPNAMFDRIYYDEMIYASYTGDPANKDSYTHIAVASISIYGDEDRQPTMDLDYLHTTQSTGSSNDGNSWGSKVLEQGWDDWQFISGGGSTVSDEAYLSPDGYAAKLYLNYQEVAELTLRPVEGGEWIGP